MLFYREIFYKDLLTNHQKPPPNPSPPARLARYAIHTSSTLAPISAARRPSAHSIVFLACARLAFGRPADAPKSSPSAFAPRPSRSPSALLLRDAAQREDHLSWTPGRGRRKSPPRVASFVPSAAHARHRRPRHVPLHARVGGADQPHALVREQHREPVPVGPRAKRKRVLEPPPGEGFLLPPRRVSNERVPEEL